MARVDVAVLALQVSQAAAPNANKVRQDPAVIKAAKEALADVRQAGRSTANLAHEAAVSWRRNDNRGGAAFAGAR